MHRPFCRPHWPALVASTHRRRREETALALRSTNSELVKSNVALKQQVAQLGAEQLALRTESNQQMVAFVDAQRAENLRYQAQMMELHRASAAANAKTQSKLDASPAGPSAALGRR